MVRADVFRHAKTVSEIAGSSKRSPNAYQNRSFLEPLGLAFRAALTSGLVPTTSDKVGSMFGFMAEGNRRRIIGGVHNLLRSPRPIRVWTRLNRHRVDNPPQFNKSPNCGRWRRPLRLRHLDDNNQALAIVAPLLSVCIC